MQVTLEDFEETSAFFEDPVTFFPNLYKFDPDFLVLDGFSGFQVNTLQEQYSDETEKLDMQGWGRVKNATVWALNKFLNMHNKETGKKWHKYVTCLRAGQKEDRLTKENLVGPLLQGAAYSLIAPAFDIIFCLQSRPSKDQDNASKRIFEYVTSGHETLMAKNRGFDLDPVEPGSLAKMWGKIEKQLKKGPIPA